MNGAQASLLADGRLHLHHGPIDLIIDATGPGRRDAFARATQRFTTLLDGLVTELSILRQPDPEPVTDPVARRMVAAIAPLDGFITPMAAVAGSVADEILSVMMGADIRRGYVNNGGDIAFHLTQDRFRIASAIGPIEIVANDRIRGVATSGWGGRSHSLGIADSVTVLAATAAQADAAATMIANAVDCPDHPGIARIPAVQIAPDSDLGARLVTTDVPRLTPTDRSAALDRGLALARLYHRQGLIAGAALLLQGETRALTQKLEAMDA